MRIAAVGECTVDRYQGLGIETVGGISLNFAINARQCGAQAALVSCTGDDEGGALVRGWLARAMVDASHLTTLPGRTAAQEIIMAEGGERIFPPGGYTPGVLADYAPSAEDLAFLRGFDVVAAPYFRQIAHIFRAAICDPLLPALRVADFLDGADCGADLAGMVELLDTLAIAFLSGGEREVALLLPATRQRQTVVVVTHGAGGSSALRGGVRCSTPAVASVEPIDTTGCGDAFQAAFTVAYLQHHDLDAALRAGSLQAARALAHYGATTLP